MIISLLGLGSIISGPTKTYIGHQGVIDQLLTSRDNVRQLSVVSTRSYVNTSPVWSSGSSIAKECQIFSDNLKSIRNQYRTVYIQYDYYISLNNTTSYLPTFFIGIDQSSAILTMYMRSGSGVYTARQSYVQIDTFPSYSLKQGSFDTFEPQSYNGSLMRIGTDSPEYYTIITLQITQTIFGEKFRKIT